MTVECRQAVMETPEEEWKPLSRMERGREVQTGQEWAEVVYVPNVIAFTSKVAAYRYIAIREPLRQGVLPGMEQAEAQLDLGVCDGSLLWQGVSGERDSDEPGTRCA